MGKCSIILLVSLLACVSIVFCQEWVEKSWRDVLGKPGLTLADEKDLEFLDYINVSKFGAKEDFAKVICIIKESESLIVVCQALATLSNLSNPPDFVIPEITQLSASGNGRILTQLSLVLGKMAIPQTFPTFFSLQKKPWPGLSDNVIALLHRFGIESLAGLPIILPVFQRPHGKYNPTPFYLNYFYKLPQHCISVTCNGIGILVPYIPYQLPHHLFSELEPEPVLPKIKKMLTDLQKKR